jgi:AcrR family transcriptional regulator
MAPISEKKDRKEEIFEAALKCFNETGYYKTSIDRIAEKANISKGGIYYHFKSKDELFIKLFTYRCDKYLEQVRTDIQNIEDPEERLEQFIEKTSELSQENEDFIKFFIEFMTMGLRDPNVYEVMTSYYKNSVNNFKKLIQAGIDSGKFKNVDTDKIARGAYFLSSGIFFTYFTVQTDLDLDKEHTCQIKEFMETIKNN